MREELALRNEEIRIKDARTARIAHHRRPHYLSTERMAILERRAARGWSLEQTARTLRVTPATIASGMKRVDAEGPEALVPLREPVKMFLEPMLVDIAINGWLQSLQMHEILIAFR